MFSFFKNHKQKIPNIITIGRIIISILVIICYFIGFKNKEFIYQLDIIILNLSFKLPIWIFIGGVLFFIAAISDFVDGYLARKWNVISDFGKLMDPIADKILINSTFLILAVDYEITMAWAVVIFITRDVIVDSMRMYCSTKKIVISAGIWGKWKTTFQMLAIIILSFFLYNPLINYNSTNLWFYYLVQNGFVLLATIFSLISFLDYFFLFWKQIKKHETKIQK